jgi:hypothetical protein
MAPCIPVSEITDLMSGLDIGLTASLEELASVNQTATDLCNQALVAREKLRETKRIIDLIEAGGKRTAATNYIQLQQRINDIKLFRQEFVKVVREADKVDVSQNQHIAATLLRARILLSQMHEISEEHSDLYERKIRKAISVGDSDSESVAQVEE